MNVRDELYRLLIRKHIPISAIESAHARWASKYMPTTVTHRIDKGHSADEWKAFRGTLNIEFPTYGESWDITIYLKDGRQLKFVEEYQEYDEDDDCEVKCYWEIITPDEQTFVIHQHFLNFIWEM